LQAEISSRIVLPLLLLGRAPGRLFSTSSLLSRLAGNLLGAPGLRLGRLSRSLPFGRFTSRRIGSTCLFVGSSPALLLFGAALLLQCTSGRFVCLASGLFGRFADRPLSLLHRLAIANLRLTLLPQFTHSVRPWRRGRFGGWLFAWHQL
jgi:hypothetical protein